MNARAGDQRRDDVVVVIVLDSDKLLCLGKRVNGIAAAATYLDAAAVQGRATSQWRDNPLPLTACTPGLFRVNARPRARQGRPFGAALGRA